ncbi:PREDICTED: 60S acidic ribosomal protein P2 [Elephantulus edwardii]|uniref:60S acidic ribosomal protein P2 n=1 Tax=Elephantulus edwardii TaxID=28737 RepID=UPI0003F091D4|nr:PREDICTED: 60S acidic ribosomal protein P2 [Elephantulus edwardii]
MRYVASYLLAALGGNSSPSAKDIKKILDSVGIEADDDRLNKVISELSGKNIEDVIAQEEKKEEKKEESEESDDDMGFGLFD